MISTAITALAPVEGSSFDEGYASADGAMTLGRKSLEGSANRPTGAGIARSRCRRNRPRERACAAARSWRACGLILLAMWCEPAFGVTDSPIHAPRTIDERISIELFAAEPDIVTPVKLAFDPRGRLLVIENHTHLRPADYKGPKTDRIRILEDTNGDGKADLFTTFYEGSANTMGIAVQAEWVYVATRSEVFRIRDTDGDGCADERQDLVALHTQTSYPHNGLSGVTFDDEGWLYFGLGENYGAEFRLSGSDEKVLHGNGLGGSVFRCRSDGRSLERVATGFWNPFGLCFDKAGRCFAVDNDPGSRPPCRLLHLVPGGDYGFRSRFDGGYGTSALVSWNGELPGTLGMVSITGEGPCEILAVPAHAAPPDVVDDLIVTSWGSHRIERFTLKPRGASFSADRRDLVVGGPDFRPVGMAVAPDGWIYISDWVKFDYPVHGQGRIWRMRWQDANSPPVQPTLASEERRAATLRQSSASIETLLKASTDHDSFIRQAAVYGLSHHGEELVKMNLSEMTNSKERLSAMLAMWASGRPEARLAIPLALADSDSDVLIAAVRWVADESLVDFRKDVEAILDHAEVSERLFAVCIAALNSLNEQQASSSDIPSDIEATLVAMAFDKERRDPLRILALRSLRASHPKLAMQALRGSHPKLAPEHLKELLDVANTTPLILEAIRTLAERTEPERFELLAQVVRDNRYPPELRAMAIVGLAQDSEVNVDLLISLASDGSPIVRDEAIRALSHTQLTVEQRNSLPSRPPALETDRPQKTDTEAWLERLEGPADPSAGRRVFFHPKLAGCYKCHSMEGHGTPLGPDLSEIGSSSDRRSILKSLLQPSQEVAPQYTTWIVETHDGLRITGFHAQENNPAQAVNYMDASGRLIEVKERDVAERIASDVSIMPDNLVDLITDQELRDLLAYLIAGR